MTIVLLRTTCCTKPPKRLIQQPVRPVTSTAPRRRPRLKQSIQINKRPQLQIDDEHRKSLLEVSNLLQEMQEIEAKPRCLAEEDTARQTLSKIKYIMQHPGQINEVHLIQLAKIQALISLHSPLKRSDPEFIYSINQTTKLVSELLTRLSSSDCCTIIWFYGTFGPSVLFPSMFDGVKPLVMKLLLRLEGDSPENLKDAIRLFSGLQKMKYRAHSTVTYQTLSKITNILKSPTTPANDLTTLLLLAAKLRLGGYHQLLRNVSRSLKSRFGELSDYSLADFVKTFCLFDVKMLPTVFDALAYEVRLRSGTMNLKCFVSVTNLLSRINYLPNDAYMDAFEKRILKDINSLGIVDVSLTLQALAYIHYYSKPLLDALIEKFEEKKEKYSVEGLCNVLLAGIRLNVLTPELLEKTLRCMTAVLHEGMRKFHRLVVYQALIHARVFLGVECVPDEVFSEKWQVVFREEYKTDQLRPVNTNEGALMETAKALGVKVVNETSPIGEMSVVVFYSPDGSMKKAVDLIVEPSHCFMNRPSMLLPWKKWQYRVLEAQGFEMLSLVVAHWHQVPERSRMRHLATKLGFFTDEEILEMERAAGFVNERPDPAELDDAPVDPTEEPAEMSPEAEIYDESV